ncbi:MAG: DUF4402 domain-containing protein, partial [Sphingomicrobium sp.]
MVNFRNAMLVASAAMLFASPALAAAPYSSSTSKNAVATTRAQIVEPLTFSNTGNLDFATIVKTASLSTTTPVVLTLDDTGVLGGCAVASGLLCSGTTTAATFDVAGTPGQVLVVYTNATETMTSGTDTLVFTPSTTSGPVTLDSITGLASFGVGGSISVAKATPPGIYTGTMDVTVDYN